MESHYESDDFTRPTSRNQKKTSHLATDRTWDHSAYSTFLDRHHAMWTKQGRVTIELCVYDTFAAEDQDWFAAYEMNAVKL
jgi:hypothetical protein